MSYTNTISATGLEPATYGLEGRYSSIELRRWIRMSRVELLLTAHQTVFLSLKDICITRLTGLEPASAESKSAILTTYTIALLKNFNNNFNINKKQRLY